MFSKIQEVLLQLIRCGIGASTEIPVLEDVDWLALEALANKQGLLGVMLDGVDRLPRELRPEKKAIIQSVGQLIHAEQRFAVQERTAAEMALLLHQHGIRTYVLKGTVVAECYPKPEHRKSVDMDCFLVDENDNENDDVWESGNRVLEEQGFEVRRDFYKNSTVTLPGLTVENHRYLTPFRGNKTLRNLERWLQNQFKSSRCQETAGVQASSDGKFEGTWLYRPPVMVSALFLIEHAYSHFLHEGLTWRLVLDWQMFIRRHRQEIDWKELETRVDEFGFRRFYDSYVRLGEVLMGDRSDADLQPADQRMLADIWAPLDVHKTVTGARGKLALAGNTWRARWKYQSFTDITWLRALWIQAKGVLFERNPRI